MLPGQRISVDPYVKAIPGWLYIYKGSTQEKYMLYGGMILTGHASRYISIGNKVNLSYALLILYHYSILKYVLIMVCGVIYQ